MRINKGLLVLCLVAPLAVPLTGCGEKNMLESMSSGSSSDEAKVESALFALDAGNYDKAIAELSKLAASDERNKYLAGAYIGAAGFNTLDLITKIDDAKTAGTTTGTELWNSVSDVFDTTGAGSLDRTATDKKIDDLENALSVLVVGAPGGYDAATPAQFSNLSEARLFQAGTAAALHSTLLVSSVLPTAPGADPNTIPIDPKLFQVPADPNFFADPANPDAVAALAAINKDINVLNDAVVNVLGDNSEAGSLVDKMNEFIADINGGVAPGPGEPVQISSSDLISYLQKLKNSN